MEKSKSNKPETMKYNFSQNKVFCLEHVSSLSTSPNEKETVMSDYLAGKYCKFISNPSIISCRAFDNSICFNIDILFPTFDEKKDFKIINSQFESINIISKYENKVIYEKLTCNKNDLFFFLITVKFKITISLDPLKGNFALLQTGEDIYSLFMNDNNR